VKNGSFDKVFKKFNSWDKDLYFTSEKIVDNRLIFLDCKIFIADSKIEFKIFENLEMRLYSQITKNP
jgi:hypothetical protein